MYIAVCEEYCGVGETPANAYSQLVDNSGYPEIDMIEMGITLYVVAKSQIKPKYRLVFEE